LLFRFDPEDLKVTMPRRCRPLHLALSLVAVATPLPAQDPPPAAQFEERVEVTEGLLDVLVTDRSGHVVLGLEPADFLVRVDGRPAEVTGATFYSNRRYLGGADAAKAGIDPGAVPDHRWFVLFFDDQRVEAHEASDLLTRQLEAGRDAAEWVRTALSPGDLVAVVSFDSRLRLHQDFTADTAALAAAIERASRGQDPPGDWPSRREERGELPSLAAGLPPAEELSKATPRIYDALEAVARATAPIVGRKNLILFTRGFGRMERSGAYVPDRRYHEPMLRSLNAANVAVYTVDLVAQGTRHTFEGSLTDTAAETGGRPFLNVLSFRIPLDRIAEETNGYYLVSVRLPGGEGGYREVEIDVADPGFVVKARGGFQLGG
jgi:VWFA-related protein